ncbi:MAG: cell division protein FtsA [Burkholderiales bacterium]|nr:cell division protein FtsA [Burkholderiales bacterium]MDQ3197553.1 cell division protein FtsA [Pseudomonadota bacterium]
MKTAEWTTLHRVDQKNLIVGLDIGTSKIVAVVAEIKPEGGFEIIGMGSHPSRGLKKGVVVNIESTVTAIQRALEEAELMGDCKIREVYTGIAGSHIKSFNSHGMVAIKDKEVTQMDVERVIETAKAVNIPTDQQILHILNQEFIIDGQEDVREPLGMSGMRLEVKVHIVTGAVSAAQNIMKCVRRCGLEARDLVLQPLASANAVLSDDEKDLGVCLVDIGGGTADIAVFTQGAIRHTAVIPIAGEQITNDLAMALRTPTKDAEDIKLRYGCALRQLADPKQIIEVAGVGERGPRQLSRQTLAEVIEPRVEELYSLIQAELRRSGYEDLLSSGVVITGGSSAMPGMVELGEEVFHLPVRQGMPSYAGALAEVVKNPRYSTAVGLLWAAEAHHQRNQLVDLQSNSLQRVFDRMRSWFQGNF